MKIGAMLLTTESAAADGIPSVRVPSGSMTAGRRLIAALKSAGVDRVAVVYDERNTKDIHVLSDRSVRFLEVPKGCSPEDACRAGIQYLLSCTHKVLLFPEVRPLVCPDTIRSLAEAGSGACVPAFRGKNGFPLVMDRAAAEEYPEGKAAEPRPFPVEDPGVCLTAEEAADEKELLAAGNERLLRTELSLSFFGSEGMADSRVLDFLELIEESGSILRACDGLGISYATAAKMLQAVKGVLGAPAAVCTRGGRGSETVLTEEGRQFIKAGRSFEAELEEKSLALRQKFLAECREILSDNKE